MLPRRTTISRRAAHEPASGVSREQVIAANVDVVFVVHALGQELDPRLIERYVALAVESGARPVVLLTKADLEPDPDRRGGRDRGSRRGHPGASVSCSRDGWPRRRCAPSSVPGSTGALLGPSGVGKSTLVNALVGDDARLATGEMGVDGAGRHTTTRRELVLLPGGGMIVDNPGMREVHLWIEDELCSTPSTTSPSSRSPAGSPTAGTRPSQAAPFAPHSSPGARAGALRALPGAERELAELAERLERRERSRARRRPDAGAS